MPPCRCTTCRTMAGPSRNRASTWRPSIGRNARTPALDPRNARPVRHRQLHRRRIDLIEDHLHRMAAGSTSRRCRGCSGSPGSDHAPHRIRTRHQRRDEIDVRTAAARPPSERSMMSTRSSSSTITCLASSRARSTRSPTSVDNSSICARAHPSATRSCRRRPSPARRRTHRHQQLRLVRNDVSGVLSSCRHQPPRRDCLSWTLRAQPASC